MDNWLNKLERKYGAYAIPGLTKIIICTYLIGYLLQFAGLDSFISFSPFLIMRGQVWRLISWVLMPPSEFGLFTLIMLLFYYSIGNDLEKTWGDFRYNFYIFSGIIFTIIGGFAAYFLGLKFGFQDVLYIPSFVSTYYINMSIFFAFAASYPNMTIMFYFIIPLRIKWIAIFYGLFVARDFFIHSWCGRIVIIASLLNFLAFYLMTKNTFSINPHQVKRRRAFRKEVFQNSMGRAYKDSHGVISKHKCAVCGRTELDDPSLEFRFCSKCNGNYEYCQDHLFTHKHRL